MSQEDRQVELRAKTEQLLRGSLKHARGAALAAALVPLAAVALSAALQEVQPSGGPPLTVTDVTNNPDAFHAPVGLACQSTSGKLVTSINGPGGVPYNFALVDPVTGAITQFSTVSGATGGIKVAAVHISTSQGGFTVGDVYAGNGQTGQLLKISADGSVVNNPWVTLPGETAVVSGIFQDQYGPAGGDLIVVTGNEQNGGAGDLVGNVWRITSSGAATLLRSLSKHLEGVTTVPNDPVKYGPLAGQILVGDEDRLQAPERDGTQCRIIAIDPASGQETATLSTDDTAPANGSTPANYFVPAVLCPQDFDIIPAATDFFGDDRSNNRLLRVPASDFAGEFNGNPFSYVGDILVTKEFPTGDSSVPPLPGGGALTGLNVLHWDDVTHAFQATALTTDADPPIARWGDVTFAGASACGDSVTDAPAVRIVKRTNGIDANDPNAVGTPNIPAGSPVAWTYEVTNTGNTSVPRAQVVVTDNTPGVTPTFASESTGDGDMTFEPGEVWVYAASGTALNLTMAPPAGVHTAPNSCTAGGAQPPRTAYTNIGTVTIPGASAHDASSYCNPPPAPNVSLVKFTNGQDANDPNAAGVPNLAPGAAVTWTYRVTNTGETSTPRGMVSVTDNTPGVTPTFTSEISGNGDTMLDPGEVWLYTATGTALNLAFAPPPGVHTAPNSCTAGGTQPARTAYVNMGSVTIPGASASDPSSYCNLSPLAPLPCPAGSFTYTVASNGDLNIIYDQFPAPNDNSYGVNAVGWGTRGHTFSNLTGSDHAGFQLVDANGVVKLDFAIDYITAKTGAPSGYASLGATGGDGSLNIAADGQGAAGIIGDTSLARNLNNLGYFVGGVQTAATKTATNGTDLLLNSPKTVNTTDDYRLATPNPWVNGWDFHDTYFVTITAARLASLGFNPQTWQVRPNADELHNSPAKPCPTGGGGGSCNLSITLKKTQSKEVQITIANGATVDSVLTALSLTWPVANGKLMQIKLDGDIIYDKPDIPAPSANITTAQLMGDLKKRTIQKGSSDVLHLIFEKNVDTNLSHYSGALTFGDCVLTILP